MKEKMIQSNNKLLGINHEFPTTLKETTFQKVVPHFRNGGGSSVPSYVSKGGKDNK